MLVGDDVLSFKVMFSSNISGIGSTQFLILAYNFLSYSIELTDEGDLDLDWELEFEWEEDED